MQNICTNKAHESTSRIKWMIHSVNLELRCASESAMVVDATPTATEEEIDKQLYYYHDINLIRK